MKNRHYNSSNNNINKSCLTVPHDSCLTVPPHDSGVRVVVLTFPGDKNKKKKTSSSSSSCSSSAFRRSRIQQRNNNDSNNMSFLRRRLTTTAPAVYCCLLVLILSAMTTTNGTTTTTTMAFQTAAPSCTTMGLLRNRQLYEHRRRPRKRQTSVAPLTVTFASHVSSDLSSSSSMSSPLDDYPVNSNDHRYSASEWWHNLRSLPRSTILHAIRGPVLAVMTWSAIVSLVYHMALHHPGLWNHHRLLLAASSSSGMFWCIGSTGPHSFLVSALGLLLVFRTNSAYQRFTEGRKIWEQILSTSRCISRLVLLYPNEISLARRRRVLRLLGAFPYLLHQHIQPAPPPPVREEEMNHPTTTPTTTTMASIQMPWVWSLFSNNDALLQNMQNAANRPLWICDKLCQEFVNVAYTPNFTSRERLILLSKVDQLSQCVGQCERIHQTAVPLNYARHLLRSLTLWLFTLPFCLIRDGFGLFTVPIVMGLTSWLLFGIYQIGFTIEDPFQGSLRLSALCDAIFCDVMHGTDLMKRRMTAFNTSPADAKRDDDDDDDDSDTTWDDVDLMSRGINHPPPPYQAAVALDVAAKNNLWSPRP